MAACFIYVVYVLLVYSLLYLNLCQERPVTGRSLEDIEVEFMK